MEFENPYTIGSVPAEGDQRKCPKCEEGTLKWIDGDDTWLWWCEKCEHQETSPDEWSVPVPETIRFVNPDTNREFYWKNGKVEWLAEPLTQNKSIECPNCGGVLTQAYSITDIKKALEEFIVSIPTNTELNYARVEDELRKAFPVIYPSKGDSQ